jgi:hypothetical protein
MHQYNVHRFSSKEHHDASGKERRHFLINQLALGSKYYEYEIGPGLSLLQVPFSTFIP